MIVIIIIFATVFLCRKYFYWAIKINQSEKDCRKIDTDILPELKLISNNLSALTTSFNNFVFHLGAKNKDIAVALFVSKSPVRLTNLGVKILVVIGGKDFIDKNLDELLREMDKIGIKTALDSQTSAPLVINVISNKDSFKNIKDYIFKNPYYTEGPEGQGSLSIPLDMNTIQNIMGIYLRDKYLEKHPHLNPEDIPSDLPPNN
ncbi:MAG: hypothetical protein ACREHG_08525 [Candidatus Saccharimonadales bacterium]